MRLVFPICLLVVLAPWNSCSSPVANCKSGIAWYYWKSSWQWGEVEKEYLSSGNSQKVFLRLFDVDWDEENHAPVPVGLLEGFEEGVGDVTIIPVIFITNRAMQQLREGETDSLASKIIKLVQNFEVTPAELQLDCDWTATTRERYFQLVSDVKKMLPGAKISVTIRLHQFKYPDQTGVPPADGGMLMVYNMGDVERWETENSILDPAIASQYLKNASNYPFPLDIALPLFQWGCTYRDGNLVQLFHNLSVQDMADTARFHLMSGNRYVVKQNTFLNGFYLNKNDRIRLEEVDVKDLKEVSEMLAPVIDCCNSTIAFYHIDSIIMKKYKPEDLQGIVKLMCE